MLWPWSMDGTGIRASSGRGNSRFLSASTCIYIVFHVPLEKQGCVSYSLNKTTSVCARTLRATRKGGDPLHNLNHPRVLTL